MTYVRRVPWLQQQRSPPHTHAHPQVLGVLEAVWRRGDLNLERALYSHANAVTNK